MLKGSGYKSIYHREVSCDCACLRERTKCSNMWRSKS